jgi:predicted nucleotidyltransferase/uncharacterized protein (UPF0332 family)
MEEKRLQEAREFGKRVLEKYGNLVKSIVLMGSVARGEFKPESDIDIIVILDDTIEELTNEKLEAIDEDLEKIAKSISDRLSIQPSYTLTEFVDYARSGHPIVYNFIKEGEPIFDAGFFMPWKRLLKIGKIQGTREAIESYMEDAPKKIARAKTVKLLMLAEDCYYAMVNSTQAVLMFMGLEPPVPSKLYDEVMEYLVKSGLLEEEYAKWLKEIVQIRKDIEHKKLLEAKGEFVDQWIEKAEKYVEKMFNLLNALEIRKKEKILERTHEVMLKAVATALKALHKLPENMQIDELEKHLGISIRDAFKRDFIDSKRIEGYYFDVWKRIEELKKEVIDEKKLEKLKGNEVEQLREYVRKLIHELSRTLKEEGKNIENR